MRLHRLILFAFALVLIRAAWARAPHHAVETPATRRVSYGAELYRESANNRPRSTAESLRSGPAVAHPIYATQNPR